MRKFNLKQSEFDKCVYFDDFEERKICLVLYVDDGLVLADCTVVIDYFFTKVRNRFDITESDVNNFVSIEVERNRIEQIISHRNKIIETFWFMRNKEYVRTI